MGQPVYLHRGQKLSYISVDRNLQKSCPQQGFEPTQDLLHAILSCSTVYQHTLKNEAV